MGLERLQHVKESLICAVENQICQLDEVSAEELGAAIDMIKDLEEALYYCAITDAMAGKDQGSWKVEEKEHHSPQMYYKDDDVYRYRKPMMYHEEGMSIEMPDHREGRSPHSRKMYMEAKEKHHDKNVHLRELEKYAQELTSDIVEMIQDASADEKSYMEKKISALASKIGQMK